MTRFDSQLESIFGSKKKFGTKELEKVLALIRATNNIEDCKICKNIDVFRSIIWDKIDIKSNDLIILSSAAVVSSIIETGKKIELSPSDKTQTLLTRLHQIYEKKTTTIEQKIIILNFISSLVINILDKETSKAISPIFSVLIWKNIDINFLNKESDKYGLKELYTKEQNKITQLPLKERNIILTLSGWLSHIITELLALEIDSITKGLCISIINLFNIILSQLPTRRFTKTLFTKSNLLFHLRSRRIEDSKLLLSIDTLEYFLNFPINEFTGEIKSQEEIKKWQSLKLESFQSLLFQSFKAKLDDLIFCSSSKLHDSGYVHSQLTKLDDSELDSLLKSLDLQNLQLITSKNQKIGLIVHYLLPGVDLFTILTNWKLLPTFHELETLDVSHLPVLPSLTSMNLSINDLLLRNYQHDRLKCFIELSEHLQRTLNRFEKKAKQGKITGNSRHAIKINSFKVDSKDNGNLKSLIKIDLQHQDESTVVSWNELSKSDKLFIVKINQRNNTKLAKLEKLGVESVSFIQINSVLNNNGSKKTSSKSKSFTIEVLLDNDEYSEVDSLLLIKFPEECTNKLRHLNKYNSFINYDLENKFPDWLATSLLSYNLPKSIVEPIQQEIPGAIKKRKIRDGDVKLEEQISSLNDSQIKAFNESISSGLNLIDGISSTGKKFVLKEVIEHLALNNEDKILLISKHKPILKTIFDCLKLNGVQFNLSDSEDLEVRYTSCMSKLGQLLRNVDSIASFLGFEGAYGNDSETALNFFKYDLHQKWVNYLYKVKESFDGISVIQDYPFKAIDGLPHNEKLSLTENLEISIKNFIQLKALFDEISRLKPLEYLSTDKERIQYLLESQSNVLAVTCDDLSNWDLKINFQSIIFLESNELNMFEIFQPLISFPSNYLKRLILIGDNSIQSGNGLYQKLVLRNNSYTSLSTSYCQREIITESIDSSISSLTPNESINAGILDPVQIIKLQSEEMENTPGFYVNVLEAEFTIFFYQYLRLLGYPLSIIGILTPFKSQKLLLDDVAKDKCVDEDKFGIPDISTIEDFRGNTKEIIIVSLTRTDQDVQFNEKTFNKLLSYAKSGFYCVASPEVLEYLKKEGLLSSLLKESTSLKLIPEEKYGTKTRVEKPKCIEITEISTLYKQVISLNK